MVRTVAVVLVVALLGCTPREGPGGAVSAATTSPTAGALAEVAPAPQVPQGGLSRPLLRRLRTMGALVSGEPLDRGALAAAVDSGDARLAWFLVDLLRFVVDPDERQQLLDAYEQLTGVDPRQLPRAQGGTWAAATNQLLAWDLPAAPDYRLLKASVFLRVDPKWRPFFTDAEAAVDWRLVTWGGVWTDDRAVGDASTCSPGCIPALDDPALTDAAGGSWHPDNDIVFTVVVGDEAVALPRRVMEVHEMVNLTVGGRRLGIPYCALCGSAQAYLTDSVNGFEPPLLRTTGLLSRSNKVTFDLHTYSLIDTFTGESVSGPLHQAGRNLEQVAVGATTWGDWKAAHPDTKIIAEDGGIGRSYDREPLRDRGPDEPQYPVGPVDPRLPVQARVIGVVTAAGEPIAFPSADARAALDAGDPVELGGARVLADGGALRVEEDGVDLPAHEAYWFAWSQFHPETLVWTPLG